MTYNNNNNNNNNENILVTLPMNKPLQQLQNYDLDHLSRSRQKAK
jgi:hypothetical protein